MMSRSRTLVFLAIFFAIALQIAGCGKTQSAAAVSPTALASDPGLALVQQFKMGAGLESLANQVAHSTTTFGVIAEQHGVAGAEQLVKNEISKALPTYQIQWDQNLAAIYSRHFSADELRSLVAHGTSSPYASKFSATQATVAAEMRATSSQLLQKFVTEALTNAAKQ